MGATRRGRLAYELPLSLGPWSLRAHAIAPYSFPMLRRISFLTNGQRRRPAVVDDLVTAYRKDPALSGLNTVEVLLYPGLWALWTYRVANRIDRAGVPLLPRAMSEMCHFMTGIEIHPRATIGRRCFIDHGDGVVIGETAELGDDVMLYHGVTLGGRGWWTDQKGSKRHPTIGNGVTLGARATVLGPVTIGDGAMIGAHALVVDDVPPGDIVRAPRSTIRPAATGTPPASLTGT